MSRGSFVRRLAVVLTIWVMVAVGFAPIAPAAAESPTTRPASGPAATDVAATQAGVGGNGAMIPGLGLTEFFEFLAIIRAYDKVQDKTKAPVLKMWPQPDGRQVVELETWLAIDEGASAWKTLRASASVGWVTVRAEATPLRVVWEFADETIRCYGPGIEYFPGATGPAPCGKDWDHTSEVQSQRVKVWIEYTVTWRSSTGRAGFYPIMKGRSQGPVPLDVGEVQAYGVWGGRDKPSDPGLPREIMLEDRADCDLIAFASGECGTGAEIMAEEAGCKVQLKFWEVIDDCASAGVQVVVDTGGTVVDVVVDGTLWVLDKGWDLFYSALPPSVRAVVDELIAFLDGCGEFFAEALSGIKNLIMQIFTAVKDPVAYIEQQLELVKEIKAAIEEDAAAFAAEFFGDLIDYDLLKENPTKWMGKIGCEIAVGLLTGGASATTGRFAKVFNKMDEFIESVRDWRRRRRNGDDSESDSPWLCNNSFLAGTPVLMADGSMVPIEWVEPGDRVVTYDTENSRWRSQVVLDQWSARHRGAMATALLGDGSRISATADHPFWVESEQQWVELDEVAVGATLLSPSREVEVDRVTRSMPATAPTVWELDVAADDNFVVGNGSVAVLVHNGCKKQYDRPDPPANYRGRSWDELMPDGKLPSKADFPEWWDNLSVDELKYLTENGTLKTGIGDLIREGGQHEWCMCSQMTKSKEWDLTIDEIRDFTTDTADVRGIGPPDTEWAGQDWGHPSTGVPNNGASAAFHKELSELIENSGSPADFADNLPDLLDRWGIDEGVVDIPDWD